MKVAVILAHLPAGWRAVETGTDIEALKEKFKTIKVDDTFALDGIAADIVIYMDTGGTLRRKKLSGGSEEAATAHRQAEEAQRQAKQAELAAVAKAKDVATLAVNVVKDAVLQFANEVSTPAEPADLAAAQARADTEAGPEAPPPAAEPTATESSAASGDEPENHFAAPPPRRAKRS